MFGGGEYADGAKPLGDGNTESVDLAENSLTRSKGSLEPPVEVAEERE